MPVSNLRMHFNNAPASAEQLALVGQVKVDLAIGVAAEAELMLPVGTDDGGAWSLLEEAFTQPQARVRVEVQVGDGSWVPLIDGPVVGQRFELGAEPESSQLVLLVHDDSALLNRDDAPRVWEQLSPSDIATQLFSSAGLTPQVDSVALAAGSRTRQVVQRGSAMQLLQRLAREQGMFAYVEPGTQAGTSVGVFARPAAQDDGLPGLVLLGPQRNIGKFEAHFDALRPQRPRVAQVQLGDHSVAQAEAGAAPTAPLGEVAALDSLAAPAATLARPGQAEQADLDTAVAAAADLASWAWQASGELSADGYPGVLRPYRKLNVTGVGGHLSGDWLVSRVTHEISDAGYHQQFSLARNARAAGAGAAGGVPAGVF